MTGSGNDFVMIDGRHSSPAEWTPEDMRAVCARATGVGADGIVFVSPEKPGTIRMIYHNSDGSQAAMCGNAALCATRLAAHLGMAPASGMQIVTDSGTYESRAPGALARAELHLGPVETPRTVPGLGVREPERRAALAVVGVPHLVVLVDDVEDVAVVERGRALRHDAAVGPAGANVNFLSPGPNTGEWRMRTYERGVEAETLACGTGAVAAACTLDLWQIGTLPASIVTRTGLKLDVRARRLPTDEYGDIWLTGEARMVLRGVLA